jgi:preprotein translocase subunit SecE
MENQRKWVVLSYAAFAGLCAFVLFAALQKVGATIDLEAKVKHADVIVQFSSIAIGLVLFALMYTNTKANQFMDEVFQELGRVTWPTKDETSKATVVVLIMVLISGVILGGFDRFFTWLLKLVL